MCLYFDIFLHFMLFLFDITFICFQYFSVILYLIINENKIKYLLMTRRVVNKAALIVGPYSFEQNDGFKYLVVNLNTKNNIHNDI